MIQPPQARIRTARAADASASSIPPSAAFIAIFCLIIPALVAYGIGTAEPVQVVAISIAIVGLVTCLASPYLGLVIFTLLVYARPEDVYPALAGMHLTLVVACVTMFSAAIHLGIRRQPLVRSPLNVMVLGFTVFAIVSTFGRGNTNDAIQDIGKLALLALLVVNLMRTPGRYRTLVSTVLVSTLYLAVFSLYRYTHGGSYVENGLARSEGAGIFGNPNDLCDALSIGVGIALSRFLSTKGWLRLVYIPVAATLVGAALLTHSRGGMIAIGVAIVAAFVMFIRNRGAAVLLGAATAAMLIMLAGSRAHDFDTQEESANSRFHFWITGIDCLVSQPFRGVGYQQFPNYNNGYAAHNSLVTSFAELGFPAFFFYMGCIYYCFRRQPLEPETDGGDPSPPADSALAPLAADLTAVRVALAAYLVGSFFSNHTYSAPLFLLFAMPTAAAVAAGRGVIPSPLSPQARGADAWRIFGLCALDIAFTWVLATRLA